MVLNRGDNSQRCLNSKSDHFPEASKNIYSISDFLCSDCLSSSPHSSRNMKVFFFFSINTASIVFHEITWKDKVIFFLQFKVVLQEICCQWHPLRPSLYQRRQVKPVTAANKHSSRYLDSGLRVILVGPELSLWCLLSETFYSLSSDYRIPNQIFLYFIHHATGQY